MRTSRTFFLAIAALFFLTSASIVEGAKKTPPGQSTGAYKITVFGYYSGNGTADVSKNLKKVSLDVTVETEDGGSGTLTAKNLHIRDNHFSGKGTALGKDVMFDGRIDVPDGVGEEVQSARIVCSFESEDGHRGRFAGYMDVP